MERPVALNPLLLPNLLLLEELSWLLLGLPYLPLPDGELLSGDPEEPDVCACALSIRHAVQNAIPATICFLILPSFRFLLIARETDTV
jgi:hypothetical protein